jgi:hypothetical protein
MIYVAQILSVNMCALQMQMRSWSQRSETSVRDRNGILICDHHVCDVTQREFSVVRNLKLRKGLSILCPSVCYQHHYVEIVLFGTQ